MMGEIEFMRLEELVNKFHQHLNQTDEMIWKYIYHHKIECRKMSIHQLAAACNVSSTTIVRFAQKLSLDGFSDLKTMLKIEADLISIPEDDAIKKIYVQSNVVKELKRLFLFDKVLI
jgi:RpiR family transcriptional regulator, glv operon transcriptional regulator